MTAISYRPVSDRIAKPLREVAQRQWMIWAACGALQTLIVALSALLVAALLLGFFDRLWMPVRVFISALAWLTVLGSAIYFLRPALRRWGLSRAAAHVEHVLPGLQERISSAVELSQESDPRFRGSPYLVDYLVGQAEADAATVKPAEMVRTDAVTRWALAFVPVLLAWILVVLMPVTAKPAMAGMYRLFLPWKGQLPMMLTRIVVKPGNVVVVQGDALDVRAHISEPGAEAASARATLVRKFENGQKAGIEMDHDGSHDFRTSFMDLQQSFSYSVSTGDAESEWYTATVHPRPSITRLDMRYEFPPYTRLDTSTEYGQEGTIEALVGTKVTITIHTSSPIVPEKSRLVVDEKKRDELSLAITPTANANEYQASLVVNHSGDYRIRLANEFDVTNRDDDVHPISAQFDQVPTIVILSPGANETVRPSDEVPVLFQATDDFAVTKIEAILQVDDHPQETVPVRFSKVDPRNVMGPPWLLSVPDVLKRLNLTDADHIAYQLKVTDNRDPDPQFSFSARQVLKIDKSQWQSYAQRMNAERARSLTEAIQKAIQQLEQSKNKEQQVANTDQNRSLTKDEKMRATEVKEELGKTSRNLEEAADKAMDSVFQEVAQQVKDIAENGIKDAAESAAKAEFASDEPKERLAQADIATKQMEEARQKLQKLIEKQEVQHAEKRADAAQDLAQAAKLQREAAEKMQSPDPNAPHHDAQKAQEADQAQRKAIEKLQEAMNRDERLRDDPKANETARQLAELAQKVEEIQKQEKSAQEQNEKQQAHEEVARHANELAKQQEKLNQDIQKMAESEKKALEQSGTNPPNKDQQNQIVQQLDKNELNAAHDAMNNAVNQLKQNAQQLENTGKQNQNAATSAQNEQKQADVAADALKKAAEKNEVPKGDDPGIQKAQEAAQNIQNQANNVKPQTEAAQKALDAARADAEKGKQAAQQAAQKSDPQEAQQQLQEAAKDIQQAAQELAHAAQDSAAADQQAAAEAKGLAERQEALAKALEPEQKGLAKAQENKQDANQMAQQQQQLAQQAQEATQKAQQLENTAKDAHNANVAARAKEAQGELQQAQQHASAAGQTEQQSNQEMQAAGQQPSADAAGQHQQAAAQAEQQAAREQQSAQEHLAKAQSALRNLGQELAKADGQQQGEPQDGNHEAGDQGESMNPQQAEQTAAQRAQEAAQAQQQALHPNPAAAHEAAKALEEAASAMAQAVPGSLKQGQAHQGDDGEEAGQEPGKQGKPDKSATARGQTADSKSGIQQSGDGAGAEEPKPVQEIGISADEWGKLPPLMKQELLNAAQQSGPPSYRQMIKNYYVKIARMQSAAPPTRTKRSAATGK